MYIKWDISHSKDYIKLENKKNILHLVIFCTHFLIIDLNIMCRVILCPEVRESCSLYIYIYIVCVEFLKELSFVCSLNE